jgi:beta-galactosidase
MPAEWSLRDGRGVLFRHRNLRYLAGLLDDTGLQRLMTLIAAEAGLPVRPVPEGVRLRRLGNLQFAFNYNSEPVSIHHILPPSADCLVGRVELAPATVAVWRD